MSLVPLVEKCGMTVCEIKNLQARVKQESYNLQLRAYFIYKSNLCHYV